MCSKRTKVFHKDSFQLPQKTTKVLFLKGWSNWKKQYNDVADLSRKVILRYSRAAQYSWRYLEIHTQRVAWWSRFKMEGNVEQLLVLGLVIFCVRLFIFVMNELEDWIVWQLFKSGAHLGENLDMLDDGNGIQKLYWKIGEILWRWWMKSDGYALWEGKQEQLATTFCRKL